MNFIGASLKHQIVRVGQKTEQANKVVMRLILIYLCIFVKIFKLDQTINKGEVF